MRIHELRWLVHVPAVYHCELYVEEVRRLRICDKDVLDALTQESVFT